MKQLQNNFTTSEQSKRLLELGLPADSADFMYLESAVNTEPALLNDYRKTLPYISCWSVGRLIEIELTCREQREGQVARLTFYAEDMPSDLSATNILESLIAYMERGEFKYDFSKLED